jgi:hypothetical protein
VAHSSHPLTIELFKLPKGERAVLTLRPRQPGEEIAWTLGDDGLASGFVVQPATGAPVALQQLTLDARQILVVPAADVDGLRLLVRVRSSIPLIGGEAELRGSAAARFSCAYDAITVVGFTSWYCRIF